MSVTIVNIFIVIFLTVLICNVAFRLHNMSDIFTGETQANVISADCKSNIVRDDVLIYTCDMMIKYELPSGNKYSRRIIVIGHTLYIPDRTINIQYDPNNPFDVRIKQTTYKEMSNTILIISICVMVIVVLGLFYRIFK